VEHVGVDIIGAQMLQRGGERLPHLGGIVGLGIIGEPVILAARIGELGLQEEIAARDEALSVQIREGVPHALLEVVPPLVGRVDAAEPRLHGQAGQRRCPFVLPGRAVEKRWVGHVSSVRCLRNASIDYNEGR
jgi:hypothetical protein